MTAVRWRTSRRSKVPIATVEHVSRRAWRTLTNAAERVPPGTLADLTVWQWLAICATWEYRCAYCGRRPSTWSSREKLGIDHVEPLSRGGEHTATNVVPCCVSCNASKSTLLLLEWVCVRAGMVRRQLLERDGKRRRSK